MKLDFASLLHDVRIRAFLRVIREGETSQGDEAYQTIVGGGRFESFADHPRQSVYIERLNLRSTAAGAYQFILPTWEGLVRTYGFADFKPYTQDCAAVALIYERQALEDVIEGRFEDAVRKCNREWASLPGSPYGQGGITMTRARAVWEAYGGGIPTTVQRDTQPAAPIIDRSIPARPADVERINNPEGETVAPIAFILPLLQSLFQVFTPLAQAKLTQTLNKQTGDAAMSGQMAQQILDIVKQAAGTVAPAAAPAVPADPIASAVDAVATVRSSPTLVAKVEANVLDYLAKLSPMIDKIGALEAAAWAAEDSSRNAAAARTSGQEWRSPTVLIALAMLGLPYIAVARVLFGDGFSEQLQTVVVTAAVTGILGYIGGYYFGTTRNNSAKDVVIAEMARRA